MWTQVTSIRHSLRSVILERWVLLTSGTKLSTILVMEKHINREPWKDAQTHKVVHLWAVERMGLELEELSWLCLIYLARRKMSKIIMITKQKTPPEANTAKWITVVKSGWGEIDVSFFTLFLYKSFWFLKKINDSPFISEPKTTGTTLVPFLFLASFFLSVYELPV